MGEEVSKFNKRLACEVIFVAFILFLIFYSLRPSDVEISQTPSPKAAIVDQLSIFHPNQSFIQTSTEILTEAGFNVDYYKGEIVTVGFYKSLPLHDYDLIILRAHSGVVRSGTEITHSVAFFTSEPYSTTKYISEQLSDEVMMAVISEGEPAYFAITPKLVRSSMEGRFENTLIIMMGCDGLLFSEMAEALVERGALAYISWNGGVIADHTDRATICLLQRLITEKQTIMSAVIETMMEVGPDPTAPSTMLLYYPPEAEDYTVRIE